MPTGFFNNNKGNVNPVVPRVDGSAREAMLNPSRKMRGTGREHNDQPPRRAGSSDRCRLQEGLSWKSDAKVPEGLVCNRELVRAMGVRLVNGGGGATRQGGPKRRVVEQVANRGRMRQKQKQNEENSEMTGVKAWIPAMTRLAKHGDGR